MLFKIYWNAHFPYFLTLSQWLSSSCRLACVLSPLRIKIEPYLLDPFHLAPFFFFIRNSSTARNSEPYHITKSYKSWMHPVFYILNLLWKGDLRDQSCTDENVYMYIMRILIYNENFLPAHFFLVLLQRNNKGTISFKSWACLFWQKITP